MAAMERLGLVSIDDDSGAWVVPRWSERQYESDDVTKRTRKHRSRERSNEHGGNVPTSFPGTDQRTETENRTNTSTRAEPFAADFAACWELFPRREGRAAALRAYTARRRAGASADDLLTATKHYAAAVAGTERRFVKLGSTFYGRDEPWRDHLTAPVEPDPYAEQEVTYR